MSPLVLATLNARYIHSAFGLRYLMANLGELASQTCLREFEIKQRPHDIAEQLLALQPRVLGLGVYLWNATQTLELVDILKQARPELVVVLGGPEISYDTERQPLYALADYVVAGEADLAFPPLARALLSGQRPEPKLIRAAPPAMEDLALPYELYSDEDLAQRVVYVEASRGCPFSCEFCLSSLDIPVRRVDPDRFLPAMQKLLDRGATQFKFVDRTFNVNIEFSRRILQFFLERLRPGLFLHFEMIPDRLPEGLRELIAAFPPGVLQFEVGVQTLNPEVEKHISRRQNQQRMAENFAFLSQRTGVHLHADLVAGLPGETLESFAQGFDQLRALGPQEIQVGILKRLKGTPIVRHDERWQMRYNPHPPFEVLQTATMDFVTVQRLRRFARHWDIFANSGRFPSLRTLLWHSAPSPFWAFWAFSDWVHQQLGTTEGISVTRQFELAWAYLTGPQGRAPEEVALRWWEDYQRGGRSDRPAWLRPYLPPVPRSSSAEPPRSSRAESRDPQPRPSSAEPPRSSRAESRDPQPRSSSAEPPRSSRAEPRDPQPNLPQRQARHLATEG